MLSAEITKRAEPGRMVLYISSLVVAIIIVAASLLSVAAWYHPPTTVDRDTLKLFALKAEFFQPEPLERTLFIVGILILPFSLMASYSINKWCFGFNGLRNLHGYWYLAVSSLVAVFAWYLFKYKVPIYSDYDIGFHPVVTILILAVACSCIKILSHPEWLMSNRVLLHAARFLSGLAFISPCFFSLFGMESLRDLEGEFNAVFHAVVEVFFGKQLLWNFQHQYGLYPHFIEPVFRLVGLSVLKFSILMTILILLSYCFIFKFIKEHTNNRFIAYLSFTALVYYTHILSRIEYQASYFQYYPIRFIMPAVSIYFTARYIKTNNNKLYYLLHALSSLSMFWNFDTGFVVSASWILLLLYRETSSWNLKKMMFHVMTFAGVFALISALFQVYMQSRYGHILDFSSFFIYQQLFYLYGFYMLPMPLIHPWNLIALTYAAGLLIALAAMMEREISERTAILFYLSVLGIGLFSYYQGRSHDHNLTSVAYCAFLLLAVFSDELLARLKSADRAGDRILLTLFLSLLLVSCVDFIKNIPNSITYLNNSMLPVINKKQNLISRNASFIRQITKPNDNVLILSLNSGIYILESQNPSPMNIPGTSELFLKSDFKRIHDQLVSGGVKKVLIDNDFQEYSKYLTTALFTNFRMINTNGSISLFVR